MKKVIKRLLPAIMAVILLLNPLYGIVALAEEEPTPTPVPAVEEVQSEPTATPTPEQVVTETTPADPAPTNTATATDTEDTNVINNNEAQVDNDVNTSSNTGENTVLEPTPTIDPEYVPEEQPTVTPIPTLIPTEGVNQEDLMSPTPVLENEGEGGSNPSSVPTITLSENQGTQNEAESNSNSSSENQVTIENNNNAEVVNFSDSTANTGGNIETDKDSTIETGDAQSSVDVVNFINTNLVGSDFWQLVISMFASSDNDIDLTKIEGYQSFDPALLSVLAKNDSTGDGTVNIALANFLSSYSVYNTNNAQLTNNVNVTANTGDNNVEGKRSEIETGDASAETNVFNLVNTNLVGNNWFFSIINLFRQQSGDLILPYELQYLLGDEANNGGKVTAVNQDTGENSQNQANACSINSTTVNNNNQANIDNNINASSNTGNNTIVGKDSSINTGDAQSLVDLLNVVNTNIYGSRWLMLAINNYGSWNGDILGWWGNKLTVGNTTYIWIKLPDDFQLTNQNNTVAVNQDTGDNSQNQAIATQTTSLEVVNNNTASVTNNINVEANTGNNQIEGKHSEINTGNANANANVVNIVNTNIIGNNWFFGVINIFGNFLGNIIFPRPDLLVVKSADKPQVASNNEVTFGIFYQDIGRLWAKNVVIKDVLPAGLTFVSASNGGVFENGSVYWRFDKVNSQDSGVVTLIARVNSETPNNTNLTGCANISTGTDEPNKDNNQSCVNTLVVNDSSQPTVTPGPTVTPTPGNGEDNGNGTGGIGGVSSESGGSEGTSSGGGYFSDCTQPEAPAAPRLLSAVSISPTEVKLTWEKVDRANRYLISYGVSSGNYFYGNPNVGDTNSYVVGSLKEGQNYYFVVAAGINGDCPVAGPYSNELSLYTVASGGILGVSEVQAQVNFEEGEINRGISTEAGEVAGTQSKGTCPVWWLALLGQTILLGGFYGLLLKRAKNPRFWWVAAPLLVGAAYLVDSYAHTHWFSPSKECPFEPLFGAGLAVMETAGFKLLKKGKGK